MAAKRNPRNIVIGVVDYVNGRELHIKVKDKKRMFVVQPEVPVEYDGAKGFLSMVNNGDEVVVDVSTDVNKVDTLRKIVVTSKEK